MRSPRARFSVLPFFSSLALALLVGLLQNYIAFLEPKLALISNIGLMTAILMWRPQGMMPVVKAK